MNWLKEIALALRMLQRDSHSGEIGLLAAAIVIAVASLTTVEFFTGRVEQALARQSNQLLGADLTISSDRPLDPEFEQNAHAHGLKVTHALRFPSMAVHVDGTVLTEIKAVADGYPLRGELRIADQLFGAERVVHDAPAAGTVWVDARLLTSLNLKIGDKLKIGQAGLRVVALVTQEPDSMTGFFNSLPRLLMNEADVAATGLIQRGSRVRYIFYVAGDAGVIDAYRTWAQQHVASWQHIENVRDARPEVRSTLERAGHFLGLAALLSVIIAAVAIALTARRFVVRHLDACAVMRCFGARQAGVVRLYSVHFLLLGLGASVVGCIIGYLAQTALAAQLAGLIAVALPQPGWLPAAHGLMAGIILLAGFALPPLMSLGQVPALRVLRRDIRMPRGFGALGYALGAGAICGLVLWQAHDFRLGIYVLGAFLAFAACSVLLVRALIALLGRVRTEGGVNWRYGIANLRRRTLGSVVQIVAFSVGIMALLTLTLIRGDLLTSWKVTLRPDLPDRFIINIQPDQTRRLAEFFSTHGVSPPPLFPMVRGRLVAINGRTVSPDTYPSDRAKRLVDREFNLSWADRPQPDNRIIAGQWWNSGTTQGDQLSVEEGVAETLGLKLGDALTYDVAGSRFIATITNLRKVDWDSFQVNFFVIAPPVLLQRYPASFITSFHAPSGETTMLNQLVREFPNLVMIDVAQIMAQVQHLIDQVARAVQFVFLFTLAAGLAVLYAAIASTRDERGYEAAIMRVLGARRGQVMVVQLAEFALIGALAGLLAATGASVLGYVLAHRILRVPYVGSPWIWPLSVICGGLGIAASGWLGVRRVLAMPPLQTLRKTI